MIKSKVFNIVKSFKFYLNIGLENYKNLSTCRKLNTGDRGKKIVYRTIICYGSIFSGHVIYYKSIVRRNCRLSFCKILLFLKRRLAVSGVFLKKYRELG